MTQQVTYTGRNKKLRGKTFQVLRTKSNPRIKGVKDVLIKLADGSSQWVSGRSVGRPGKAKAKAKAKAAPEPGGKAEKRAA
jgi:hypothetical protein